MDNEYELRYLPLFYEDMYEKVTYGMLTKIR